MGCLVVPGLRSRSNERIHQGGRPPLIGRESKGTAAEWLRQPPWRVCIAVTRRHRVARSSRNRAIPRFRMCRSSENKKGQPAVLGLARRRGQHPDTRELGWAYLETAGPRCILRNPDKHPRAPNDIEYSHAEPTMRPTTPILRPQLATVQRHFANITHCSACRLPPSGRREGRQ